MIFHRTPASSLVLGSLLTIAAAAPLAQAEDYVRTQEYVAVGTVMSSRCADFGPGFVEMGNGVCGRVGSTARVQLGTRNVGANAWTAGGTTSAALRSDGMPPRAGVQHLRVRNGVEFYSPFH